MSLTNSNILIIKAIFRNRINNELFACLSGIFFWSGKENFPKSDEEPTS
jgi:hypothetical protein